MRYLVFDTETTGLPKNWQAEISDLDNWPRLVQLAYCLFDKHGVIAKASIIIRPDGYDIPKQASDIHGVTMDKAENGVSMSFALGEFAYMLSKAHVIIAHNIKYDRAIMGAEFLRAGMDDFLHGMPKVCTMAKTTNLCKIPSLNGRGYKWPKLIELYKFLFNEGFDDAHDALVDIEATRRCFNELIRRGIMDLDYFIEKLERSIGYGVPNSQELLEEVEKLKKLKE